MNSAKLQGTKSMYQNLAFLYTNNEATEREIKKLIPFTIPKIIIYLGINLTKEVKDLYAENNRLMKEIEEDTKKWKTFHAHGLEEQTLLKCLLPKAICTFNAIPIK